ncbi:MAG: MFS transporter, partial [Cyclobacteriaceae bacterium]
ILGAGLFFLGFAESNYLAIGICFIAGICWQISFTSLLTSTHYALPQWYGARGMAYFLMAMAGSMAIGSALWGLFAEQTSLQAGLQGAGILGIIIAMVGTKFSLDLAKDGNYTTPADLPELNFPREEDSGGWVLVHIIYMLGKADKEQAVEKLKSLKNNRYRSGAIRWKLFTPADKTNEIVESFYEVSLKQYELHREQVTKHDQKEVEAYHDWLSVHGGKYKRIHYLEL